MKKRFEKQIKELTSQSQKSFAQIAQVQGEDAPKIQSLT